LPLHILVISDSRSYADYLCQLLGEPGHKVSYTPEGKAAFQAIRAAKPELIIVAVETAKVAELAREQRLYGPSGPRNVPVIVISDGLGLEPELLHLFDFIPKPLDEKRLLHNVAVVAQRPAGASCQTALNDQQYQEFSKHLLSCAGLQFEARNRFALERGVSKRMAALHINSSAEYLDYLKRHGENRHEFQKLIQFLTVGETYFFRYPSHFTALKERLSQKIAFPGEPIRIWSAGCSTGEEPYSIAISIMETFPDWKSRDIKIIATDINHQSIRRAREGVYSRWAMRITERADRERYFEQIGESFVIRDQVKSLVQFTPLNLSSPCSGEICGDLKELDAIFCRNVLIYFPMERAAGLVQNFADALKPSGQLFLGHAETVFQRAPTLEIRRQGGSFYYVKSATDPAGSKTRTQAQAPPPAPLPSPGKQAHIPATQTKHPATVTKTPAERMHSPAESTQSPAARLATAQELFDAERFDAALELLEPLLGERPDDAAALVLKGFVLAGKGRLQEALETSCRVITLNDLLPGAYFLKGVVLDAGDQLEQAANEYRKAMLLDHDFIMPRYYMGRLHLRLGRRAEAEREIKNSIKILSRRFDDATIPYSGGLTRAVCLQELQNALDQVCSSGTANPSPGAKRSASPERAENGTKRGNHVPSR
jgi:chemotaxis protein methyltransferase CheR